MSNPAEQMFLYGNVDREYPYPTGILALIGCSDLTAAGGIVLALIILTCLAVDYWAEMGWFSQVLAQFIIFPMKLLAVRARPVCMQLQGVRSTRGTRAMIFTIFCLVLKPVVDFILFCLTPLRWLFPSNRPGTMLCRLLGSAILFTKAYSAMLLPGSHFVRGAFTGFIWRSMEEPVYCPRILDIFDFAARPTRTQWLDRCYCLGAESGLQLRVIAEDDWKLFHHVGRLVDGEIYHIHGVAIAAICGFIIILAPWWSEIMSWAGSCWIEMLVHLTSDAVIKARLRGTPLTERESQLWDTINGYEGDVRSLKGLLKAKSEELKASNEELTASKKIHEDGWAHAKSTTSKLGETEALRTREAGEAKNLRAQVETLNRELEQAQCKAAEATFRMRKQAKDLRKLEKELEKLDEDDTNSWGDLKSLSSRRNVMNEQLAAMEQRLEQRLAAVEERDSRRHQKLLAKVNKQAQTPPSETNSLRSQLDSKNEQLFAAEKGRIEAEEREKESCQSHEKLSAEVVDLKNTLAQKDEQEANALAETDSVKAERDSKNEQLIAAEKGRTEAEEGEKQSRQGHEKLSAEVVDLKNKLAQKDEQATKFLAETKSLKAERGSWNKQVADIKKRVAAAEARENQSSVSYQELSAKHDELVAKNRELTADNKQLQDQYTDIFFMSEPVGQMMGLEQERDSAREQVTATEQRLAEAEAREKQSSANYEQLAGEHKQLSDKHSELVDNNLQLVAKHDELQTQYKDLSSSSESAAEISTLVQRMNEFEVREKHAQGVHEQLSTEHKQLSARYDELVAGNGQLTATHEELKKQYQDLSISEPVAEIYALEQRAKEAEDREKQVRGINEQLSTEHKQLSVRYDELVTSNGQLTAKHEDLQKQCQDLSMISDPVAEICALELRVNEAEGRHEQVSGEYKQLMAKHQELQGQYDELFFMAEPGADVASLQNERDEVKAQLAKHQDDFEAMRQMADTYWHETQASLAQAEKREEALRQSLGDLRGAYEMTIQQERSEAKESWTQASKLTTEVKDHQRKIGLAMRDAQRSHEEAQNSKRTIEVLEQHLSKHSQRSHDELQRSRRTIEDLERRLANSTKKSNNMGSVSTALAQTRVTVSTQQTEINQLKGHLEQARATAARPSEEPLRGEIVKLRKAIDMEKRARTEDQIRWDKRTRELQAENQKLTISLSNKAGAAAGGLRKSTQSTH